VLGGSLKRRERISARLGDILSQLYLASAVLKRYDDEAAASMAKPLVNISGRTITSRPVIPSS
jgi:acyl-CoA dehydrogenase